jgi:DNA repair protein RadA/Sms
VLLGGDPGHRQVDAGAAGLRRARGPGLPVLYVAGEESPEQVRLRADRLGLGESGILIVPETTAETVVEHIDRVRPCAVVVDSIQTLRTTALASAPGSVGQVRESARSSSAGARRRRPRAS